VGVQGAGRPQRSGLGVLLGRATPRHVKRILYTSREGVKGIRGEVVDTLAFCRWKGQDPGPTPRPWDEIPLTYGTKFA
jgi:hypothetical protein